MCDHSQKNLGICSHLEIVGKINMYMSDIIISVSSKDAAVYQLKCIHFMNVEDNCRLYEGKDAFLRLPTSFGMSVRYEVLLFVCLTVNKAT